MVLVKNTRPLQRLIQWVGLGGILLIGAVSEAAQNSAPLNDDFAESVALVDQILTTTETVVFSKDIKVLDRLLVDHLYAANLRFVVPEKARKIMTKQQLSAMAGLIRKALSQQICQRLNKRILTGHLIYAKGIKYGKTKNIVIVPTAITAGSSKINIRWYMVKTRGRFYVANVIVAGFNMMGQKKTEYDKFLKRYDYSAKGIEDLQLYLAKSAGQGCNG